MNLQRLRLTGIVLLGIAITSIGCGGGSTTSNSGNNGGGGTGGNSITNPTPSISGLSPAWVSAGTTQTLTVNGTNFISASSITVTGPGQPATFSATYISSTQLQVALPSLTSGVYQVTVSNPSPGGGVSSPLNLTVTGFATAANLNTARWSQSAPVLSNGDVLITGGFVCAPPSPNQPTGGCAGMGTAASELYSGTPGAFALIHPLNLARSNQTATVLPDGEVLVATGLSWTNNGGYVGSAVEPSTEIYNPTTQTFSLGPNLITPRENATATLLPSGEVLIVGGQGGTPDANGDLPVLTSAELYNPQSNSFSATGNLNMARYSHTATLLPNGQVLIVGGFYQNSTPPYSGNVVSSAELYDPASGTFTLTTQGLITARYHHTATLLANGKVLIAGGYLASGCCIASAELYDPSAQTFTSTGNMNQARGYQTATLLASGQVLMVSGTTTGNGAELYDPTSGTFSTTANLNSAREGQTATLLPNLQVLIAGGFSGSGLSGGPVGSTELYLPPPAQTPMAPTARSVSPSSVSPGTTVVLEGTSFLPGATVLFDGSTVVASYLDETLLGFTVPAMASAGSHTVAVSNPGGGKSGTVSITVN